VTLLWLTLVVAMGLGWFVRERKLQSDVTQSQLDCDGKCIAHAARERTCRSRIEAIEGALGRLGWAVRWDFRSSVVTVHRKSDFGEHARGIYESSDAWK
jgi:hypothetical protein